MILFLDVCIVTLLLIIVFQDFLKREIGTLLVAVLGTIFFIRSFFYDVPTSLLNNISINITFIILQLLLSTIYFSIKEKQFINIIDTYIGLGDIAFLILLCLLFSPSNLIAFYIVSLFVSLALYFVYMSINKNANKTVPLAGLMAIVLIGIYILKYSFVDFSFQGDQLITQIIEPCLMTKL